MNGQRQGQSEEDVLSKARTLARIMDASIPVPGTNHRIGFDGLLGLIPGIGDSATAALSSYIVYQAYLDGVSRWTLARMVGNVLIDVLIGAIPLFGDVADFFWKSNMRNIKLWTSAIEQARSRRKADRRLVIGFVLLLALVVGGALWVSFTIMAWTWHQLTKGQLGV